MQPIINKKIIILFIFLFFLPNLIFAQSFELSTYPQNPEPGDFISVSVSPTNLNISNLEVSWYKDGKLQKKEVGLSNFSFQLDEKGNTIRVLVKANNGNLIERIIKIEPKIIDVLWEVLDSYQPPLYKGKSIPIIGSRMRVVAVPQIKSNNGNIKTAKNFSFLWQKDGSNFLGQSGYGVDSFTFSNKSLDLSNTINVTVSDENEKFLKSLIITPKSPEIHFYEYRLSSGPLYNKALSNNQSFNGDKINIIAEPYFIGFSNFSSQFSDISWNINGQAFTQNKENIVFLNVGKDLKYLDIKVDIKNKSEIFQNINRLIKLNLNNE